MTIYSNKTIQSIHIKFSGHVNGEDIAQEGPKLIKCFSKIKRGYALIEEFDGPVHLDQDAVAPMAMLLEMAESRKINLVVKVVPPNAQDPGLSILHKTRLKSSPPEMECQNQSEAKALVKTWQE